MLTRSFGGEGKPKGRYKLHSPLSETSLAHVGAHRDNFQSCAGQHSTNKITLIPGTKLTQLRNQGTLPLKR